MKQRSSAIRRLIKCSPDLSLCLQVKMVRGLDKHWLVDTPVSRQARRGMMVLEMDRWLTPLEMALLMPDPEPEIVEALIDAGAGVSPICQVVAVRTLMRVLDGNMEDPRSGVLNREPSERWKRAHHIVEALSAKGVEWERVEVQASPPSSANPVKRSARWFLDQARRRASDNPKWGDVTPSRRKHLQL